VAYIRYLRDLISDWKKTSTHCSILSIHFSRDVNETKIWREREREQLNDDENETKNKFREQEQDQQP